MTHRCTATVYWWDIGVTVGCVRHHGHHGLHRDGTRWFDDAGFQQPRDEGRISRRRYLADRADRLTTRDVTDIRGRHAAGHTFAAIARDMAISYNTVRHCALRLTYQDVA
jgi:hypothetical protein